MYNVSAYLATHIYNIYFNLCMSSRSTSSVNLRYFESSFTSYSIFYSLNTWIISITLRILKLAFSFKYSLWSCTVELGVPPLLIVISRSEYRFFLSSEKVSTFHKIIAPLSFIQTFLQYCIRHTCLTFNVAHEQLTIYRLIWFPNVPYLLA